MGGNRTVLGWSRGGAMTHFEFSAAFFCRCHPVHFLLIVLVTCTDDIGTLRIIVEQCIEWQSSLYINFVDFVKAFDSIDRTVLWKLLRHYGLPTKFITLIKNMYEGFIGHVIFNGQVSEGFHIGTGV